MKELAFLACRAFSFDAINLKKIKRLTISSSSGKIIKGQWCVQIPFYVL